VITSDNSSLLYDKVKLSSGDEARISALSKLLCGGGQELRASSMVTIGGQNIQKCFKDKGFYTKNITGTIDNDTIDAQKREIKATLEGKVDSKTGKLIK
jgi:chemotaxis receptor (MCP) glutamine deamidase CheD